MSGYKYSCAVCFDCIATARPSWLPANNWLYWELTLPPPAVGALLSETGRRCRAFLSVQIESVCPHRPLDRVRGLRMKTSCLCQNLKQDLLLLQEDKQSMSTLQTSCCTNTVRHNCKIKLVPRTLDKPVALKIYVKRTLDD